eukprot:TRINITY_DN9495_c0_g1_i2.p1 TRINITY_DN9495_c0_g1~~TRINITY_DN9495_c0_g1_i2.p1  ORF type:complete len:630 (-),score=94.86 TRINITY_DN9495_c0_g1_i2:433-2322(-)
MFRGEFFFGLKNDMSLPMPVSSWDFSRGLEDQLDDSHLTLYGSAKLTDDGLLLGGSGFAMTEYLTEDITQKTLEVCIELKDLEQEAVGVVSIGAMDKPTADFDAITYNQRGLKQWMSCSEFFHRSKTLDAQGECEKRLVHLTATYDKAGNISIFRDGIPYGTSYAAKGGNMRFAENKNRFVFGARHVWPNTHGHRPLHHQRSNQNLSPGANEKYESIGSLRGKIKRAALFDQALTPKQVRMRAMTGRFRLWLLADMSMWEEPGCQDHLEHISSTFPFTERFLIDKAEDRGMSLVQLTMTTRYAAENCHRWSPVRQDGQPLPSPESRTRLCMDKLNLYDLVDWLIKPATLNGNRAHIQNAGTHCSFVELIAEQKSQSPTWFISHWWGEAIIDFLRSVGRHVKLRNLAADTDFYWICAYANRQHHLELTENHDLEATSFYRAMMVSKGVLCVLDDEAKPFSRIWCAFEEYVALENIGRPERPLLFDVVTVSNGEASILSDGVAAEDENDKMPTLGKADREQSFPLAVIKKALEYKIEDAEATREKDKERILEWIGAKSISNIAVGQKLRTFFAARAWRQCIMQGQVDDLKLPDVISNDNCEHLQFDLSYLFEFRDEDLRLEITIIHIISVG